MARVYIETSCAGEDRLEDPIVDEVRAVREAIDAEVGHDVAKLAERARRSSLSASR
jgi:hypothetical protein